MKKTKILLTILLAGLINFGLYSCASTSDSSSKDSITSEKTQTSSESSPEVTGPVNTQTKDYLPTSENVKLLGRSIVEKDLLLMCYSSTGAEFNVSAKRLDVSFQGDSNANPSNKDNAARLLVFVNGQRMLDEMLTKRAATYTIFDGNDLVEGIVQVLKVSECANSIAAIKSISTDLDGKISPTPAKNLKIEFVGDSITCGYGVDDLVKEHHFKTSTEDNTKTYAYKTAKALDADYSMVSISGWGIVSGYSGDGNKNSSSVLPKQYSKLGYSWSSSINGKSPQSREWDFSLFQPDFLVVNLGTNDASYTKGNQKKVDEYTAAYVEFLTDLREKNPKAKIICSLGIMGGDLYPALEKAVEEYKNQSGDKEVSCLRFANQSMADGIAADWHPSEKTHEKAAALLTSHIKALME
ncbi:MAG: hypothetical protein K5866_09255 [Treponema sp.]|nr:hypothetical protein [Treponema sp.]